MPIKKVFFTNSKSMKLAAWLHVPEGKGPFPAVVRVHGYGSSKDGRTSVAFAEAFSDIVFLRFDFHGHGESEGKFEEVDAAQCVDDLKCAVEYVRGLDCVDKNKIAVTGSSLGGLATTLAAAWHDKVVCAVMVCPVSEFEPLRARDIKYKQLLEYDVYKEAEKIMVPVLIIHGDKDDVVPIEQSIELAKHLRRGTLHIVKDGDHSFSDQKHHHEVISVSAEFIRERMT